MSPAGPDPRPTSSLFWRLLPTYLAVIAVGAVAAVVVGQALAPYFLKHSMDSMMGPVGTSGMGGGMAGSMGGMTVDLDAAYRRALTQSLAWASVVATLVAAAVALVVTSRIVAPLRAMTRASERIADGRYGDRLDARAPGEVGELAGAFNRMADTLQRSEERRVELLADVAHEFRTPLSNLRGYVEGLEDGVFEDRATVYQAFDRQLDRLGHLVDDLSLLSRVETGQIALDLRSIDTADLVEAALAPFRPDAERRGVHLSAVTPDPAPWVRADRERTLQVLTNLLGNALRFTPDGGRVRVTVSPTHHDAVRVSVADDGPGIAPEDLPNVFKRFYRGDKARSPHAGGSGIGLTIARQLVERQGGEIGVTSQPGEGATFAFTLPAAAPHDPPLG